MTNSSLLTKWWLIFFSLIFFNNFKSLADLQLPPEESAIINDVDHWGLAFSDQLDAFKKNFQRFAEVSGIESPDYILAVESSLRKTFRNKYWFKGKVTGEICLHAGKNESESFQLAIIPDTGFDLNDIQISVSEFKSIEAKATIPSNAMSLWRVGFVKTVPPQYPTRHIGYWPDPLLQLEPFSLTGLDLGLIWCEIEVPHDTPAGDYTALITVNAANSCTTKLAVKLHVWNFALPDRIPFPTAVWTKTGRLDKDQYLNMLALFLEHHIDPISVGRDRNIDSLDSNLQFCFSRGLRKFQTPKVKQPEEFKEYYEHIKKKGWLDKAMVYGENDEPSETTFRNVIVHKTKMVREKFPALKTFLATQYYQGLEEGTDIWLCDVSTNFHSWLQAGRPGQQELWWYFCGIPIRVTLERPIPDAPRMFIDRDAIEHRLVYWMARYYDVKGVFIWAGNITWPKDYELKKDNLKYPYAGIFNGSGFLIYPPLTPSIRLKIIRDGIEDYWYMTEVAAKEQNQSKELIAGIRPSLFVDTHYFNRDPEGILTYRKRLGEFLNSNKKERDPCKEKQAR